MSKTNLLSLAASLSTPWRSSIVGKVAGANFKVLRMDGREYANESHSFDEALLVLDGVMRLKFGDDIIDVRSGEVYIVPAGIPHAVANGSSGTLVIIDQPEI
jgi:mannose-6-phosphate isomerase-like protein (cupin superfamily)